MQVTITARHLHLSSHTTDEFREKIAHIGRFDDHIQYIDVVCSREHDQAQMEWKIGLAGSKPLVLHTEGDDLKTCVDILMDKAEKALTKNKEIRTKKDHHRINEALTA